MSIPSKAMISEKMISGIPFIPINDDFTLIYEPMEFVINVPASQADFATVGGAKNEFSYNFFITHLTTLSETDGKPRLILKINEKLYPTRRFIIDDTPTNREENSVKNNDCVCYYCNNGAVYEFILNLYISKDWTLEFLLINSTATPQKVYITIYGYVVNIIPKKAECPFDDEE